MISNPDNEQDQAQTREEFIARLKSRLEQAQADGQSPEEIQKIATALGREELQRQLPQLVVQARSWWTGFRRFLIVGTLALGFAIGLALYVEHHNAAPADRHGERSEGD